MFCPTLKTILEFYPLRQTNCGGLLREQGKNDRDTIWSSLRLASCLYANSGGVGREEGPVLIPATHPECVALTNLCT